MGDLADAILGAGKDLGVDPVDLGTAISYETGGTFDPWAAGPTTQWGQHRGLIQWGEPQRQQYGVHQGMPVAAQMQAVERYLLDRGVRPGMGLADIYSAINAGHVGLYGRSDAANGGAPGTVADKVGGQMGAHRLKALALLQGAGAQDAPQPAAMTAPAPRPALTLASFVAPTAPQVPPAVAAAMAAGPPQPVEAAPALLPANTAPLAKLADLFGSMGQSQAPAPTQTAVDDARQARRRALIAGAPDPFTHAVMS